ncbi:hypothetical protein BOTBODRAFT_174066 [Botryobasidium botryosum FD-172 SS1]|uniref:Uncharacterized protein n=1 Tax=Botryobasidium botryosum (strain FD-172 SS1) TaxID=930990 RepID=A0A067MHF5_BOTB1|nr:hypothetical protein BOTBODRAFT_174066 [Botryobasidium botryosum FD-172 SS1]
MSSAPQSPRSDDSSAPFHCEPDHVDSDSNSDVMPPLVDVPESKESVIGLSDSEDDCTTRPTQRSPCNHFCAIDINFMLRRVVVSYDVACQASSLIPKLHTMGHFQAPPSVGAAAPQHNSNATAVNSDGLPAGSDESENFEGADGEADEATGDNFKSGDGYMGDGEDD